MPLLSDREGFDKHAGRMAALAIRSKAEQLTIQDIGNEIGHPVSEDDLRLFIKMCDHWGIRCNVDDESWWKQVVADV